MRALVITVSNRASAGVYEDTSGPLLTALLFANERAGHPNAQLTAGPGARSGESYRQALSRAAPAEREMFLRLAGALGIYWFMRGQYREGSAWLERALTRSSDAPSAQY